MQQIVEKYVNCISTLYETNRRTYEKLMRILFDTDGGGYQIDLGSDIVI